MLLTEDEAKKRWCPFARVSASDCSDTGNHALNRFNAGSQGAARVLCLGSACMAWRLGSIEYDEHVPRDGVMTPEADKPEGDGWVLRTRYSEGGGIAYSTWEREKPRRGFCGLADSPA